MSGKEVDIEPNKKLQELFKYGRGIYEDFCGIPQIYLILCLVAIELVLTVVQWVAGGFYWPAIFFFLLAIPLGLMVFVEVLSVKWHLLAQSVVWTVFAVLFFVEFLVAIVNYSRDQRIVGGLGQQYGFNFDFGADVIESAMTSSIIYIVYMGVSETVIVLVLFFLVRSTIHAFKPDGDA